MAFLSGMNKHVVKYRLAYFVAMLLLLAFLGILRWVGHRSPVPSTSVVTFTIIGDAALTLHLQEVTRESTEELIVNGIRRFEKRIQVGSEVGLKWYTLNPGHNVRVDVNQGLQTLEQQKGDWTFIIEPKHSCFISCLGI